MNKQNQTKQTYEQFADEYEEKTLGLQRIGWMEKFRDLLPSNSHILDLGCAFCRDSETYDKWGFKVTGLDFSKKMIEKAKKRVPNASFIVQDMLKIKFDDESFDGVWAMSSLLHITKKNIPKVLVHLNQLLRPDGIIFIGTYLGEGEGFVEDERYEGAGKYYSFFSEEEIKELLNESNFEIIDFIPRKKDDYERNDVVELIARKISN